MEHKKEDGHQPYKGRQGAAALTDSHNHRVFSHTKLLSTLLQVSLSRLSVSSYQNPSFS